MPKRDFTGSMLERIQKEIDWYFDSITRLDRISFYFLSNTLSFLTKNCMQNYIMSLSTSKEKAENKIKEIWKAVFEVENQYKAKFEHEKSITQNYQDAIKSISDCIDIKTLSTPMNFNKISTSIDKCYINCIESQARKIIVNKAPDEFTDEDVEIIGYAYMNTKDSNLKADILNSFYTIEDKPESYLDSTQTKLIWDKDIYYYKRSDKYEDFQKYVDHYLGVSYQQYLNGEIDDAKINGILNSHKQAYAISDKDSIISGKQIFCVDDYGNIFYLEKSVDVIGGNTTSVKRITLDGYDWIDEGEGASDRIDDKVANSVLDEYDAKVDAIISEYGKNLAEGAAEKIASLIPGGGEFLKTAKDVGKVIDKVIKTSTKTGSTVNTLFFETADSKTNDTYADNYIEWFDMKCMNSNDNYTFLPTPKSLNKIERFFEWLENDDNMKKDSHLYKRYHYDENSGKSKYEYFLEFDPYDMVNNIREWDKEMGAHWLEYIQKG